MLLRHPVRVGDGHEADVAFPGVVPTLTRSPGRVRSLGPELGAHTDEVLAELDIDDDTRAELRAQGAI